MDRMVKFEFHAYEGDEDGNLASQPEVIFDRFRDIAAARGYAGRLAKRINGPVDVAYGEPASENWNERYLTTASPADKRIWKSGFRFERIA